MQNQTVQPKDLSVVELKALGFDKQNQVLFLQNELKLISDELTKRAQTPAIEEKIAEPIIEELATESVQA